MVVGGVAIRHYLWAVYGHRETHVINTADVLEILTPIEPRSRLPPALTTNVLGCSFVRRDSMQTRSADRTPRPPKAAVLVAEV